jgi:hypothetical protein
MNTKIILLYYYYPTQRPDVKFLSFMEADRLLLIQSSRSQYRAWLPPPRTLPHALHGCVSTRKGLLPALLVLGGNPGLLLGPQLVEPLSGARSGEHI